MGDGEKKGVPQCAQNHRSGDGLWSTWEPSHSALKIPYTFLNSNATLTQKVYFMGTDLVSGSAGLRGA